MRNSAIITINAQVRGVGPQGRMTRYSVPPRLLHFRTCRSAAAVGLMGRSGVHLLRLWPGSTVMHQLQLIPRQ